MADENEWRREFPQKPAAPPEPPLAPVAEEDHSSGPLLLTPPDRPDMGCYVGLLALLLGLLVVGAMLARAGAALIVPVLGLMILVIATPLLNPAERRSERAKWRGRAITFSVLLVLLLGGIFYVKHLADRPPPEQVRER
jgi:hypothetical protein